VKQGKFKAGVVPGDRRGCLRLKIFLLELHIEWGSLAMSAGLTPGFLGQLHRTSFMHLVLRFLWFQPPNAIRNHLSNSIHSLNLTQEQWFGQKQIIDEVSETNDHINGALKHLRDS
jgi:hypothetical protein